MTLEEACSTGRVRLLDWIWASSCTSEADRVAQWTLTNYLRSDPRYYRYQFSQSMDTAAGRGELEVVRWLFSHFSGCEAPVGVVGAAVKAGHLSVVQLLWTLFSEARHTGKECTSDCVIIDDKGRILDEKLYGEFFERGGSDNIVCWADRIVLLAAENGHCDMVRWLCENTVEEQERRGDNYYQVMKHVLKLGSDDLFKIVAIYDEMLMQL
ncbi:hypothetical protein GN244_ATG10480 [Phytophthora infestans]|uniref:Ankyrin repeat-containing domain n=1 Tax=Phytophthora infestans TaxID=4787 RepID=A0A833S0U7_PHYIN|nr:hypothetical protein GN244_ATG10480 [Phytophthora infestans]